MSYPAERRASQSGEARKAPPGAGARRRWRRGTCSPGRRWRRAPSRRRRLLAQPVSQDRAKRSLYTLSTFYTAKPTPHLPPPQNPLRPLRFLRVLCVNKKPSATAEGCGCDYRESLTSLPLLAEAVAAHPSGHPLVRPSDLRPVHAVYRPWGRRASAVRLVRHDVSSSLHDAIRSFS